jgi:ankyrin repeat protein
MGMLFFLLIFVFIICVIIGLIKPTIFSRFLGKEITRKKIAKIFSIATVVSFVLLVITSVNTPKKQVDETQSNNVAAPNVTREKTDSAKTEKQVAKNQSTTENTSNQIIQPNLPEKPIKEIKPPEEKKIPSTNNQEVSADEIRKTGLKHYTGDGVKQDYQEALKLFRKAADQGDASAQYNVGLMYDSGTGVTQNKAEARKWFQKAADQGDKYAQAAIIEGILNTLNPGGLVKQFQRILNNQEDINTRDEKGYTTLMHVCAGYPFRENAAELVKFLLDNGADVNARLTTGWTALMSACGFDVHEAVELLLDSGADVNAMNKDGKTPLIYASGIPKTDRVETVKLLLDRGAEVNAKDKNGMTPLIYASKAGHTKIAKFLLDNGAIVDEMTISFAQPEIAKLLKDHGSVETEKQEPKTQPSNVTKEKTGSTETKKQEDKKLEPYEKVLGTALFSLKRNDKFTEADVNQIGNSINEITTNWGMAGNWSDQQKASIALQCYNMVTTFAKVGGEGGKNICMAVLKNLSSPQGLTQIQKITGMTPDAMADAIGKQDLKPIIEGIGTQLQKLDSEIDKIQKDNSLSLNEKMMAINKKTLEFFR